MKFCEECGAQVYDGAKFCPRCGNDLSKRREPAICHRCGAPVEENSRFCAACGAELDAAGQPSTPVESPVQANEEHSGGAGALKIFGILLMAVGAGLISYGSRLNNSLSAQLGSFLSDGSVDPGTVWMTFGAASAVLGLVLLIAGFCKK